MGDSKDVVVDTVASDDCTSTGYISTDCITLKSNDGGDVGALDSGANCNSNSVSLLNGDCKVADVSTFGDENTYNLDTHSVGQVAPITSTCDNTPTVVSNNSCGKLVTQENAVVESDQAISYSSTTNDTGALEIEMLTSVAHDMNVLSNKEEILLSDVKENSLNLDINSWTALIEETEKTTESRSTESDTESDSSISSSSSSSSDEEEEEDKEEEEDEEDEEKEMVDAFEEGEIRAFDPEELLASDEDEPAIKGPIKSKNEIEFLPPVPPVDATLKPHHQTLPVGVVLSIMDAKVIVEGREKHNPLNEGSILWITETRCPLGLVDEIFGPVKNPFYIVRYNTEQEVPAGVCEGTPVSFVADFADHVLNNTNLYKKGYDASGENDEEISDEVEFSDDEKEAEYRRAQKMASKGGNVKKRGNAEFVDRKKVQHKGSWKNSQPPAQPLGWQPGQTNSPNQFRPAPVDALFGCGSRAGPGLASAGRPPHGPPASHVAHANSCPPQNLVPPNGGWINGMTGQLQQQMVFPNGFPINGMPIQQLNHYQQPPQMINGFQGGMLFQQQFDPSQMMMHNGALPYGQPNFPPMPFAPWPGHLGQSGFNQVQFGMGFPGHQMQASVNAGNQQVRPNAPYNEQSNEMHGFPGSQMQASVNAGNQGHQMQASVNVGNQGHPIQASVNAGNQGHQMQASVNVGNQCHQMQASVNAGNQGHQMQASVNAGNHGHQMQAFTNAGNPQVRPNAPSNEQSNEMPPPSNSEGNLSAQNRHNQGRTSSRGRRPYRRGGHFSGGRGRH